MDNPRRQPEALHKSTDPDVPNLQDTRDQQYEAVVDDILKMTFQSMPGQAEYVARMKNAMNQRADVVDLAARRGPANGSQARFRLGAGRTSHTFSKEIAV